MSNNLDKDFDKVAKQINTKLTEAATAVREAKRLAKEAGIPSLVSTMSNEDEFCLDRENFDSEEAYYDAVDAQSQKIDMIDISELESAMEDAGWSMSSSHC